MDVSTDDARILRPSPNMRLKHRTIERATFLVHPKTEKEIRRKLKKSGLSGRHSALERGLQEWESYISGGFGEKDLCVYFRNENKR